MFEAESRRSENRKLEPVKGTVVTVYGCSSEYRTQKYVCF